MTTERNSVRNETQRYNAKNLDQLVRLAGRINLKCEDALVEDNFPFMVRDLTLSHDGRTGRANFYICVPGLTLGKEVIENYGSMCGTKKVI